jgi:hypothetical protein
MALKIISVLPTSIRVQARCKDSVKVTVKFVRKEIHFQQTESKLSLEWEQWSGFKVGIFIAKLLALGPFGPWSGFLSLNHCLIKKDIEQSTSSFSNWWEFLFEILKLYLAFPLGFCFVKFTYENFPGSYLVHAWDVYYSWVKSELSFMVVANFKASCDSP